MKTVSKDGKTWFQKNQDGSTSVGFTKEFLSGLECCWHMIASSTRLPIKEDQPLLSVETNDGLFSVSAPVSGVVSYFDNKALNFPDKLDDETVVALMKEQPAIEDTEEVQALNANPFAAQPRLNLNTLREVAARPINWNDFYGNQLAAAALRPRGL